MSDAIPTVVIVGRPNVGKSTLFNRITGQRRAIVGDEPGITRDRIHGSAEYDGRRFELIDTGGIVVDDHEYIPAQILRQARSGAALCHPYHLPGGWPRRDHRRRPRPRPDAAAPRQAHLAGRQQGRYRRPRRISLTSSTSWASPTFFPFPPSTAIGVDALLDHVTAAFRRGRRAEAAPEQPAIKVAIIGRPNVGKSTLLNTLTGQDRAIVSPDRRHHPRCRR